MLKSVIFDIGGVIIYHDNDKMLGELRKLLAEPPSSEELLSIVRSSGIGTGKTTPLSLFRLLTEQFGGTADYRQWYKAWTCHFSPNLQMIDLIFDLARGGIDCHVCSNTNSAHWSFIQATYPVVFAAMKHVWLSFEMGIEKPAPKIYSTLRTELGDPAGIIFVDDRAENTACAAEAGFKVHTFTDQARFDRFINEQRLYQ